MVSLDAAITGKVAIALDLASMAWIACLRFASFPLGPNDGIDLRLRKVGDGSRHDSRRGGEKMRIQGGRHGRAIGRILSLTESG